MDPKVVDLPLWRRFLRRETVEGVPVIRTYTYRYGHRAFSDRILSFVSFSVSSLLALFRGPRPDVIYASTPPLLPMLSAWLASRLRRTPLVLEVRDLWPAAIIELGTLKNKVVLSAMSWLERFLYHQAAQIVTLTDGIRRNIIERGWPAEKIHTISYGISPLRFFPDQTNGKRIRESAGWDGVKIVLYIGAHGPANNLDVILRAARRLRERRDIRFVLIGDGMQKARLVREAADQELDNIVFHPPVPATDAPAYINAADLCVVTLRDIPLFEGAVPTKLIESMACGKPVLVGARGEAESIITSAQAGLAFSPDDDAELASSVVSLLEDPARREILGRNGCEHARQRFSLERNQAALYELLVATANDRRRRSAS
jgi:glycosyltransferase involved in cell wall biosynthesis